jgi:hypothetical protein
MCQGASRARGPTPSRNERCFVPPAKEISVTDKPSRRDVLVRGAALAVLCCAACKSQRPALRCNDTTGLAATDLQIRQTLAYVDVSLDPTKTCTGCQQFVPNPAGNACGACKVVKGPINPKGNCKSWAAKPT